MLNSIENALNKVDELPIDDCVSLYRIFKYTPEELKKFSSELKQKIKEKDGFYFKEDKYKIYNPEAVSDIIDFMILRNDKMLAAKILMGADPRGYVNTVCIDYTDYEPDESISEAENKKSNDKNK